MKGELAIGIVGTGFISRGLAIALEAHHDLTLRTVLTRRDVKTCADYPAPSLLTNSIDAFLDRCGLVIECSGDVLHAANIIDQAMSAGKPVLTMNAEFHVTCGSYFVDRGMLSEAHGDQPGSLAALAEDARIMGFKPLVYGNRKGYFHPDPPLDQMQFWAAKQGLSLDQVTAATDGTKLQIEQALVANGLGATIAKDGLLGLECDSLEEGGRLLAQHAARLKQPIADYVLAPKAPAGIFIVAEHDQRQQAALSYFKLGAGPHYVLVHNYHLCHLEIVKTIRRVIDGQPALLNNSPRPTISVAAIAKHSLKRGQKIQRGIGSFDVRGIAVRIADHPGRVPIGLIADAVITRDLEPDHMLGFDDVEIPDSLALQAYRAAHASGSEVRCRKTSPQPARIKTPAAENLR